MVESIFGTNVPTIIRTSWADGKRTPERLKMIENLPFLGLTHGYVGIHLRHVCRVDWLMIFLIAVQIGPNLNCELIVLVPWFERMFFLHMLCVDERNYKMPEETSCCSESDEQVRHYFVDF